MITPLAAEILGWFTVGLFIFDICMFAYFTYSVFTDKNFEKGADQP